MVCMPDTYAAKKRDNMRDNTQSEGDEMRIEEIVLNYLNEIWMMPVFDGVPLERGAG